MSRKRLVLLLFGTLSVLAAGIMLSFQGDLFQSNQTAQAQVQGSDMQQRLNQVIEVLRRDPGPQAVEAAIDDGMEILYGGMRPLPSKGLLEQTGAADQAISEAEQRFAAALDEFIQRGQSSEVKGRALDLKLLIEQMNEVAQAVGKITAVCGEGDIVLGDETDDRQAPPSPCSELQPLLDELTGEEIEPQLEPRLTEQQEEPRIIRPGFTVKLRSPAVPRWFGQWEEDVRLTEPIGSGECAVVFKETRGLMLRLHFHRIIIVNDPWVSVFGIPRGTPVPIWTLEWIPSQYAKEWNICNAGGEGQEPKIVKTVTKRVVQDIPLKYFWRFYPKDP